MLALPALWKCGCEAALAADGESCAAAQAPWLALAMSTGATAPKRINHQKKAIELNIETQLHKTHALNNATAEPCLCFKTLIADFSNFDRFVLANIGKEE